MSFGGRLTLVSGKPVIDADVTSSTLYYTHDSGNTAGAYTFGSELSLSLAGLAGGSIHKVFIGPDGLYLGSPSSARLYGRGLYGAGVYPGHDPNPPLSRVNGVQVNSAGDPYLGSIQIDPAGGTVTCHVSQGYSRRWGVWNRYNQRPIMLKGVGDDVGIYTPDAVMPTWGPLHNNANNSVKWISGEPQPVELGLYMCRGVLAGHSDPYVDTSGQHECGIGINSTSENSGQLSSFTLEVGALPTSILSSFTTTSVCITNPLTGSNTAYALERHRLATVHVYGGMKQTVLWARLQG